MTLMRLVHAFEYSRPAETRTRGLWQCPRCKDVVEAWSGVRALSPNLFQVLRRGDTYK